MRLLRLELKPDNTIKLKAIQYIAKKYSLFLHHIKTMETYCVSCKKNTANKNSSVKINKQNLLMLISNWALFSKKKWRFIKNQKSPLNNCFDKI